MSFPGRKLAQGGPRSNWDLWGYVNLYIYMYLFIHLLVFFNLFIFIFTFIFIFIFTYLIFRDCIILHMYILAELERT